MNKKLWLVAGTPGLGKSTWIESHKQYFDGSVNVISRDQIRFAILGDNEEYFSREGDVWAKYVNDTITSLKYYENTILDATHLTPASRAKILNALGENLKDVEVNIIVFTGNVRTAVERNANRTGRAFVPVSTIRRMNAQMILPTLDEGFKRVIIVDVDNADRIVEKVGV